MRPTKEDKIYQLVLNRYIRNIFDSKMMGLNGFTLLGLDHFFSGYIKTQVPFPTKGIFGGGYVLNVVVAGIIEALKEYPFLKIDHIFVKHHFGKAIIEYLINIYHSPNHSHQN